MRFEFQSRIALFAIGTATTIFVLGCGQGNADKSPTAAAGANSDHDGHDHGGWWCGEHGVPEDVCTRCNSSLIAGFTEKGDWCDEHDRPDSQCFQCHPELEAKFAARYEAKFGKKPPKPSEL